MADQTPHIEPSLSDTGSLAPDYFDRLYAARPDPWDFAGSSYEADKYAATLAALPLPRYARALELGCSIGVLTRQLAPRCDTLLAVDVSEAALAKARERCQDQTAVVFERCDISTNFPQGSFDLVLLSEVGYYFSWADLEKLRSNIAESLAPRGQLILVHYTGETNYPLTADQVHDCFAAWNGSRWLSLETKAAKDYRLDLFQANGA